MRKLFRVIVLFISLFFLFPRIHISADYNPNNHCSNLVIYDNFGKDADNIIYNNAEYIKVEVTLLDKNASYTVYTDSGFYIDYKRSGLKPDKNGVLSITIEKKEFSFPFEGTENKPETPKVHKITIDREGYPDSYCRFDNVYSVLSAPTPTPRFSATCILNVLSSIEPNTNLTFTPSTDIFVEGKVTPDSSITKSYVFARGNDIKLKSPDSQTRDYLEYFSIMLKNKLDFNAELKHLEEGTYNVETNNLYLILEEAPLARDVKSILLQCPSVKFSISLKGGGTITPTPSPTLLTPSPTPPEPDFCRDPSGCGNDCSSGSNCKQCSQCRPTPKPTSRAIKPSPSPPPLVSLCDQLTKNNNYRNKCLECIGKEEPTGKMWTAVGCIPISYTDVIKEVVFGIGVGIAGGVAFLYFLYGAFMILTSTGNAEKLEEAKQIITSSLAGLLLIIFSIFLLQVIGVQILQLPGFG